MNDPIPETPAKWLDETRLAMADGLAAAPLAALIGHSITEANLFHVAPLLCLKIRGLDYRYRKLQRKVADAALATYAANSDPDGIDHELKQRPLLAFCVCYVAALLVLDLIDEWEADSILDFCDKHLD